MTDNISTRHPALDVTDMVSITKAEHELITEDHIFELTTPLPPIVTGSLLEQVLSAVGGTLFWLYVNTMNGLLISVIKKTHSLSENVHYNLLSIYMLCDIISSNLMFFQGLPAIIANNVLVFSLYYCQIVSSIGKIIYLASVCMLGYLAIERLVFFKYPFRCNRYFTTTKIKITCIILFSFPMLYTIVTDAIFVRVPVTTRIYCVLPESYTKKYSLIVKIIFFCPSLVISISTLISLSLLMTKHQARLNPGMIDMAIQQPIENMLTRMKRHMKILVSISGTFWLAIVPGMVIRMILFPSGAAWKEADTRSDMTLLFWAKFGWCLEIVLSSLINPVIYLTHLPDLRQAVWKRLHWD